MKNGNDSIMDISWDYEADVIVVGCGAAGLSACIQACDEGLTVIGVDSQGSYGGNSIISSGGIQMPDTPLQRARGITDSVDAMFEDIVSLTQQDNNSEILRCYCEESFGLWDWLTSLGVSFRSENLVAAMGQSCPREHHVDPRRLCDTLHEAARARGAVIHLNTRGTRIVREPLGGEVKGIEAIHEGKTVHYRAHRGVLVASGGFTRNPHMLDQHVFGGGADRLRPLSARGDDGSGLLMCMEVGADTRHMGYGSLYAVQNPDGDRTAGSAMYHMGAILVNLEGKRFVNEERGYGGVWEDLNNQTDGLCFCIWDERIAARQRANESPYYSQRRLEESGLLIKAGSIAELASLMEVPVFSLDATIGRYNYDIEEYGYDTMFGRTHLVARAGKPFPIGQPPYYAWKTTNALLVTIGGVKKSRDCQAIDVLGDPIPGLYVAGNVSSYSEMGVVPGTRRALTASGTGLGMALVFGRHAVKGMLR